MSTATGVKSTNTEMINSKEDYIRYLKADREALQVNRIFPVFSEKMGPLLTDPCYKFQRLMRKLEYWSNCGTSPFAKLYVIFLKKLYQRVSVNLGFSIHINTFGPGLVIGHYGCIVIGARTRIGSHCTIRPGVVIARTADGFSATIGDYCHLGANSVILNGVSLGNNVTVGAGAVVTKSFEEDNIVIAGVPARIIGYKTNTVSERTTKMDSQK